MTTKVRKFNDKQLLFKEIVVGTLIYAAVLSFFDDYTHVVEATSFSTIFLASFVLELLTCGAFALKSSVIKRLKGREGSHYKAAMFFCVWLIMFLSKFVFIWVVDLIFGSNISIHGFFGILLIVLTVTAVHKLADVIFVKLGDSTSK